MYSNTISVLSHYASMATCMYAHDGMGFLPHVMMRQLRHLSFRQACSWFDFCSSSGTYGATSLVGSSGFQG